MLSYPLPVTRQEAHHRLHVRASCLVRKLIGQMSGDQIEPPGHAQSQDSWQLDCLSLSGPFGRNACTCIRCDAITCMPCYVRAKLQ